MPIKTVRVATVKATGKRYIVCFLDFQSGKVNCYGELIKSKGLATTHGPNKAFLLDAVEVKDVVKDLTLVQSLFEQSVASKREEGHDVSVRVSRAGNIRATDYGKRR